MIDDQDLIDTANTGKKSDEKSILPSVIRIPAYAISSYISSVQAWITAAAHNATRDQVIKIDIDKGKTTKWEDYGLKEVNAGSKGGFWPFFSAEVCCNGKKETRTLNTSNRENNISIQLAMIGIQKFDIQPGQW